MYRFKKILVRISRSYALDPRALSLMRIGIALVIMTDLLIRGGDLTAHYTNHGVWPLHLVQSFGWRPGMWSIHLLNGEYSWSLILFILQFTFAVFLLVGFRTKIFTFLLWLLYISLHNRNLYINQAGDDLLRILLFWGLFLPWNAFFSMDAMKGRAKRKQKPLANIGYLLLIVSVYFFTICLKTSSEWRGENTAIYYALSLEQLRLPFMGDWLYHHPGLMKALTWLVYYMELAIPLLMILPAKKGYLRLAAFTLIIILHTGIGLTLYVGLFFIINMVSAIGLLPAFSIDWLGRRFFFLNFLVKPLENKSRASRPNFCLKTATNFICIVVIAVSAIINLSAVNWFRYELRDEVKIPVNALRLDQYWGMFSPSVLKRDGWYVYEGMDALGNRWDLRLNTDTVSFEKPANIFSLHKTDRWRKLTENIQRDNMDFLRPLFCRYVLKKWNQEHPEKKMKRLSLYYMQTQTQPDYKAPLVEKKLYSICHEE